MILVGQGRKAIDLIVDAGSFEENIIADYKFDEKIGPSAIVGTAKINGKKSIILGIDAKKPNPRFRVVYNGIIGMEEAYKMAKAVYLTIEEDKNKDISKKTPFVLIVDTPGNGPGKLEEIVGMNKATGAYQLALLEASRKGHPSVAIVIGRAISGAFLCHGLPADRILALPKEFGTMIHVMPITSISRITKIPIEILEKLSKSNPVFASGAEFFYNLGGVNEMIKDPNDMKGVVARNIDEIYQIKKSGEDLKLGPNGRTLIGAERGGRKVVLKVREKILDEFNAILPKII